jgi:hypothetical protein
MRQALGILLLAFAAPALAAEAPAADNCWSLTGVWEYVAPSWPGRAILARQGSKCIGVWFARDPKAPATDPKTDAEKAAAFGTSGGGAWEYTCTAPEGGVLRCKNRTLFSVRPSEVGSEVTLEAVADGDNLKWWFLDREGKRGAPGAARRLR